MKKISSLLAILVVLSILTTGTVFAQETAPITGTVESVTPQTDATTGETIYVVTLTDEFGTTHVVNVSQASAEALGLISVDATTGEVTINEVVDPVSIDPADILPGDDGEEEEEAEHPVGSKLGEYFGELLGVEYDAIMEQRENGFGFGVIAQALWLTKQIDGGTETFEALLEAKQSGDYSKIELADGSTPDNWGDVVKSLKQGENLGSVMSGKAEMPETETSAENEAKGNSQGGGRSMGNGGNNSDSSLDQGNGNGNGNNGQGNAGNGNNGNGNNGNNGKGNDGDNGNGNGNGNGKGKP